MADTQPLAVGAIITDSLRVFRRNLLAFSLLGLAIYAAPSGLFMALVARPRMLASLQSSDMTEYFVWSVAAAPITIVLLALLQAALVYGTVQDLRDRPAQFGEIIGRGVGQMLPVAAIVLLYYLGVIVGMLLLVVPGIIIALAWSVVIPAGVVERRGVFASFSRSYDLTNGHKWKIFGLYLVLWLVMAIIGGVMGYLMSLGGANILDPVAALQPPVWADVASVVLNSFLYAFFAVLTAVLYNHLRRAKEGVGVDDLAAVFD